MIRAGILGTGWAAFEHAFALRSVRGVEVVAVGSGSRARSELFARENGIPAAHTYQEVLELDAIDVIHVCTRNVLHHEQILAALVQGKHVISEKPLALNVDQTRDLYERAARASSVSLCTFNYRAYPTVQWARRLVAEGEIGDVFMVRAQYLQDWLAQASTYNWRLDPLVGGPSAALADIGSHCFDLVEHVSGLRIESVDALLGTAAPERMRSREGTDERIRITVDDHAIATVRMSNGAIGSVVVSQVSAGHKNDLAFELSGSRGTVAWSQEDPDALWITKSSGMRSRYQRGPETVSDDMLPPGHPFGWRDAMRRYLGAAYSLIGDRSSEPAVSLADFESGYRASVLVAAALSGSGERLPAASEAR